MDNELTLLDRHLHFLAAPRPQLDHLVQAGIVRLGLTGKVRVIDGGNRFDPYRIARLVRRETGELTAILGGITVARAFTCYQVLALLEVQAVLAVPLLVLDLLSTFADENVRYIERSRLLDGCIVQLQRLAGAAPVLVTTQAWAISTTVSDFPDRLAAVAERIWRYEPGGQPTRQLPLF